MNNRVDVILSSQSRPLLAILALLMVAIVGVMDWMTGYEFSSSIFYLIPISFCAWYVGARLGYVFCLLSAAIWISADLASGHQYTSELIPIWNTGVRLGFFVIVVTLLKQLRTALDVQTALAQVDGLTGLLNSRTFKQRSGNIFELASRSRQPLALGYIDLDGFKGINDQLGHSVGDQVLRGVATVIAARLRSSDIGGRLGGDEFAVLLPDTDVAGARTFFARLHECLLAVAIESHWPIGFSMGVAVFDKCDAGIDEAIKHADNLMYRVKNSGKNRILIEEFVGSLPGG